MEPKFVETPDCTWRCFPGSQVFLDTPAFHSALSAVNRATEVRNHSFSPYSKFAVGAAAVFGKELFAGTNVENASYGATVCAERTAIFTAVSAGCRNLDLLAVSVGATPNTSLEARSPCGICLQVIAEFATLDSLILLEAGKDLSGKFVVDVLRLADFLPHGFRLERE